MKSIWKFEIDLEAQSALMPVVAKILTVQNLNDKVCIWAEVDTDSETELVRFRIYGTGHEIPEDPDVDREYIGTVQFHTGLLILHVYKINPL